MNTPNKLDISDCITLVPDQDLKPKDPSKTLSPEFMKDAIKLGVNINRFRNLFPDGY